MDEENKERIDRTSNLITAADLVLAEAEEQLAGIHGLEADALEDIRIRVASLHDRCRCIADILEPAQVEDTEEMLPDIAAGPL